jgi:serine/threonine-protein kinase
METTRLGRYVLFDQIAMGGMASVHIGRLVSPAGFARTVAIKRMRGELVSDPELSSMFLDEARLAARVHHPNVVQVLDVVSAGNEILLVMEYVRGDSLARLLSRIPTRMPIGVALAIATEMLYGLHAAHEATAESGESLHIVHRDVSPQNILIGGDGVARVTDFGVAKATVRVVSTRDGELRGKISYMAPEQIQRRRLDRRTDVFAASVVFWEMLAGQRLFIGDDPGGILHRILYEPIPFPPEVDPQLVAIVMKGLARDPNDRFATAHEMATALEAFGPARAAEVASFVDTKLGPILRERAARVRAIEQTSLESLRSESQAPPAMSELETQPVHDRAPAAMTAPSAPPSTNRRSTFIALAAALLVAIAALWLVPRESATRAASNLTPELQPVIIEPAPMASTMASAAPTARPPARPFRPKKNCDPPYTVDARGIRMYKRECL